MIGFYNRDEKCLLCGTNWVFNWANLRLAFKRLNGSLGLFFTALSSKNMKIFKQQFHATWHCYIKPPYSQYLISRNFELHQNRSFHRLLVLFCFECINLHEIGPRRINDTSSYQCSTVQTNSWLTFTPVWFTIQANSRHTFIPIFSTLSYGMEGIRHSFCLTSLLNRTAPEVAVFVTGGVGPI
jgi:hypothetical protein